MFSGKLLKFFIGFVAAEIPVFAMAAEPAEPFKNPHLADSTYSAAHVAAHYTPLAGPETTSRRLRNDEYLWKPLGQVNSIAPIYSGPYPNGKRVVWVGGHDRVAKLDADTLETLATHSITGRNYYSDEKIRSYIEQIDNLPWPERVHYRFRDNLEIIPSMYSFYRLLSSENEFYFPFLAPDGSSWLRVYGEADKTDPASEISLRREFNLSRHITDAAIWGVNLTSDGTVVVITSDGKLAALSRDFSRHHVLDLPRSREDTESETKNRFHTFARNSIAIDDKGGVYAVTRDYMHRVQWTGTRLSLDETDGGWSATYPNELGIGSGTSPALMGWGPEEDHLVVIADATDGNYMVAFWRDEIPTDWKGLPGYDPRVAGSTPIHFGVSENEKPQVENSIVVYGYGAFLNRFESQPDGFSEFGDDLSQAQACLISTNQKACEAKGGTVIRWDPQTRQLKTAWASPTNFASTICTVSGANETLYCWGARNGEWGLEAVDWHTGENKFHLTLGASDRFNVYGGVVNIAPNGAIDCGCYGGLGMVRILPNAFLQK